MFSHLSYMAKRLWEEWNIRSCILMSLGFQVALIFSASSRKTTKSKVITFLIWSFYLLADAIAVYTVGLISNGLSNDCPENLASDKHPPVDKHLAAFWAPFLLLHLGGPDDITAFSIEDNQLWLRHLLGFVIQVSAVAYTFVLSFPNPLMVPTILVFLVGMCKYLERTRALYKACLDNFKSALLPKPESGPNYPQLMEEYAVMESSGLPVKIEVEKEPEMGAGAGSDSNRGNIGTTTLDKMAIVTNGYKFFDIFKGLIVDHMFSFHERSESRAFFLKTNFTDAFKVMEVELNFMYDAFYTKMPVVCSKFGYCLRFLCTALLVACFQQFTRLQDKISSKLDICVTYVLLGGALFLDLVSLVKHILSDWAIVSAKQSISSFLVDKRWHRNHRWSNHILQYSFIRFITRRERLGIPWLKQRAGSLGIMQALEELIYAKSSECEDGLKEFIFNELKNKAKDAETTKDAKEIFASRGERALYDYPNHYSCPSISSSVSTDKSEYDESVVLWHIATELCLNTDNDNDGNAAKKYCKVMSHYMLYLLVMRLGLMSAVAGIAQIRFQDTCEEAKKFFGRWELVASDRDKLLAKELMEVKTVVAPNEVKGDRSKSVLFDACILANDLNKMGANKWEMMSRVWVELLSYGAGHCRPDAHAAQLNKGGELITFVWLLMAHFGLGEQFRIEAGHARAKLLVGK